MSRTPPKSYQLSSPSVPDRIPFRALIEVIEELGYHLPFEIPAAGPAGLDAGRHIYISEGKVPGPKALGVQPFDLDALVVVSMARRWLLEIGVDQHAVEAAFARFEN